MTLLKNSKVYGYSHLSPTGFISLLLLQFGIIGCSFLKFESRSVYNITMKLNHKTTETFHAILAMQFTAFTRNWKIKSSVEIECLGLIGYALGQSETWCKTGECFQVIHLENQSLTARTYTMLISIKCIHNFILETLIQEHENIGKLPKDSLEIQRKE